MFLDTVLKILSDNEYLVRVLCMSCVLYVVKFSRLLQSHYLLVLVGRQYNENLYCHYFDA